MLQLSANKKLIQVELQKTAKVTLKDIHNISAELGSEDTLKEAMRYFSNKDSGVVVFIKTVKNELQGIFYQDEQMRKTFQSFPELLFVDVIYRVSTSGLGLYMFSVENSNGETEIVAFFLRTSEEAPTASFVIKLFKKHNPAWTDTNTIVADKDMVERDTFKEEFPQAKPLLCLFRTLRTFRREITTDKMGITKSERSICLDIAQNLAHAEDEDEYIAIFNQIKNLRYGSFKEYIENNWHPIRSEWVVCLQDALTHQNRTINRLESINSKVIQIIRRNSKIPDIFRDLDIFLMSLRIERDRKAALTIQTVPLNVTTPHEGQKEYLSLLTPYAYRVLCKRYELLNKVKIVENTSDEFISVASSGGNLIVSPNSCTCSFFQGMQLPCQHLLKIRSILGFSMFSSALVAARWTKQYYVNSRLLTDNPTMPPTSLDIDINNVTTNKVMTEQEKCRLVSTKVQKLSSLVSEASPQVFADRLEMLEKIISLWERNIEIDVQEPEGGDGDEHEQNIEDDGVFGTEINKVQTEEDLDCESQYCEVIFRDDSFLENVVEIEQTTSNPSVWAESEQSFVLPVVSVVKKRRRSAKGSELTVVGLSSKKLKENKVQLLNK